MNFFLTCFYIIFRLVSPPQKSCIKSVGRYPSLAGFSWRRVRVSPGSLVLI